jgi:hypothetical protein
MENFVADERTSLSVPEVLLTANKKKVKMNVLQKLKK